MRSNISVGPPIDMVLYETDAFEIRDRVRLQDNDLYLQEMRKYWEEALSEASENLPDIGWNRLGVSTEPDT